MAAEERKTEELFFSVILAFRNEGDFLESYFDTLDRQSLSRDFWEIILVDGCSTDRSLEIAERYVASNKNAALVTNENKIATSGWNRGLEIAKGKFFHLASGHSRNPENWLSEAKKILEENHDIDALGGRVYKIGASEISRAISAAMNTPVAMGGSYYRIGTKEKPVNVIGLGFYRRDLISHIGVFDESLGRSGDWEFNYKVCVNGYKMIFNPRISIEVFSRAGYMSTFRQMFKTGFWKVKIWAKHPKSLLPRHIIPSLFVIYLIFLILISFGIGKFNLILWYSPLLFYLLGILYGALKASKEKTNFFLSALTFPVIHIAYGAGFIAGLIRWGGEFFRDRKNIGAAGPV